MFTSINSRPISLLFSYFVLIGVIFFFSAISDSAAATMITVSTLDDEMNSDGDCSLREAIQAANSDAVTDACSAGSGTDTIVLPSGTLILTIPGTSEDVNVSGDLDITTDLFIQGTGSDTTIIDGGDIDRIFHILGTVNVEINDVTLRNGHAPDGINATSSIRSTQGEHGGAIYSEGNLTINRAILHDNQSGNGGSGGQVNIGSDGEDGGWGGVIYSASANVTIHDSAIYNNAAGDGGDCVDCRFFDGGWGGRGGVIYSLGGIMTITNSEFNNNRAGDGGLCFDCEDGFGGDGGVIYSDGETVLIQQSTLDNNRAGYGGTERGADSGRGGAINIDDNQADPVLTIINSTISNNFAPGIGGGGIFVISGNLGQFDLINSTVSGNSSNGDGGGLLIGSGPFSSFHNFTISNSTITNNIADVDGDDSGNGGGINVGGGAEATTRNSIIAGNSDNSPSTQEPDCEGVIDSEDYNLIGSDAGCGIFGYTENNIVGVLPQLLPLADNGGTTMTHAPVAGSPAIDAGNPALPGSGGFACEAGDQLNTLRPQDGNDDSISICDIGAHEKIPPAIVQQGSDVVLGWPQVSGASEYRVYEGSDPYQMPVAPITSTTQTTYIDAISGSSNSFYWVTAVVDEQEIVSPQRVGVFNFAIQP